MKKILNIFMIGLITVLNFSSCDNPTYPTEETKNGEGKLSVASFKLDIINSEITVDSRSVSDINSFTVNVIDRNTSEIKKTWIYGEAPEIITLPVGEYTLEVFNKSVAAADWDAPYYRGTKDFAIVKDEITEIGEIKCVLSNVKVTIKYTDELKAAIGTGNDVKVNVVVGNGSGLDFIFGETRSGYFKFNPESTSLIATFTGTVDGYYMSDYKVYSDIAAGQHRIITFGIKDAPVPPEEYGAIGTSGLGMDNKVTVIDMTIDVPVTEEPVDPDDMLQVSASSVGFSAEASTKELIVTSTADWNVVSNQTWCTVTPNSGVKGATTITISATENTVETPRSAKLTFTMGNISLEVVVNQSGKGSSTLPTITSESLDLTGVNEITAGMIAKVLITAPQKIANLKVKIDSPTLTPDDLLDVGLKAEFDLANPETEELGTNLSNLGFPIGNEVKGKETLTFDISQFMGLLNTFKSEHKFIITVVDENGQSAQASLIFLAK